MHKLDQGETGRAERDSFRSIRGAVVVRIVVAVSLLAIAAGLLVPSFSPKRKTVTAFQEVGPGRIEGDRCFSDFFGFSIELPRGWSIASTTELRQRLAEQEPSERRNALLILLVTKYPARATEGRSYNSRLFIVGERVSNVPGVTTADKYLTMFPIG